MADSIGGRLRHAWDIFLGRNSTATEVTPVATLHTSGFGTSMVRPDRIRPAFSVERTIINSIYTKLATDVASAYFRHVKVDDEKRYLSEVNSYLNDCLAVSPNIDQVPFHFFEDLVLTMCDKGAAVIVPVKTTLSPIDSGQWDIMSMRVGYVESWHPQHVAVSVYDERTGSRKVIMVPKTVAAVVENPFYNVMNEPNSTLKRLNYKLGLLDNVDEKASSGKLDLIIQLPYVVKSEARRNQASQRRTDIELQLRDSQYGIAYTDATERITQLNRPVENNLWSQITDLTNQAFAQLGMNQAILDGTADEKTMLNYYNRTVQPFIDSAVQAMHRTFLTKTARTQGHAIMAFRDPFKLVPISTMAEIADKFTRNEIATSNEIRQAIGWKPAKDPRADELRNSNMPQPAAEPVPNPEETIDPLATP